MPRKQVYGKRAGHVYSSFAAFTSPTKSRNDTNPVQVLDLAEQLQSLTVDHASTKSEKQKDSSVRNPLIERDGNEAGRQARTWQRKEDQTKFLAKEQSLSKTGQSLSKTEQNLEKTTNPLQHSGIQQESCEDDVQHTNTVDKAAADRSLAPVTATATPNNSTSESVTSTATPNNNTSEPVTATATPNNSTSEPVTVTATPNNSTSEPVTSTAQSLHQKPPGISNVFTEYLSSLLPLSSRPLQSFEDWADQLSCHFIVTKIAEASFGEVYRLSLLRPHPALSRADESVLKVIALKSPPSTRKKMSKTAKKRLEMMSDPADVASEVRLMQCMTTIPGYTVFRDCCLLQGRPGASFAEAWQNWNQGQKAKGKDTSVFPDPGKKASYNNTQLWAVIEMQDAGTDLENVELKDIWATWDVFWGVVLALAKGEEHVGFEHRDLHMGNICVTKRHDDRLARGNTRIDPKKSLGYTGIETTLIDYTISRAVIAPASTDSDEDVAFMDLEKDLTLFEGNAEEEYQYEIYRHMRAVMYLDDPLADLWERWDEAESSGRTWKGFHPQTNLVWLHYILTKLLEQLEWPSSHFSSEDDDTMVEKANLLEHAFVRLVALLDPQELPTSGLRAAGDLVKLAITERWLSEEDIRGAPAVTTTKGKKSKGRIAKRRLRE